MTEKADPKKEMWRHLDTAHQGAVISQGMQSNVEQNVKVAEKVRDAYSLERILNEPQDTGRPLMTKEQFEGLSDDQRKYELSSNYNHRLERAIRNSVNVLAQNGDAVLRDSGGNYSPNLVKIALEKDVLANADPKYEPLIQKFGKYAHFEKLAKDLSEGKRISEKDEENLKEIAAIGAYKLEYEAMAKKGYNERLCKQGAEIAAETAKFLATREQMRVGLEKMRDDIKAEFEKSTGRKIEDAIGEYVSNTLVRMARSGNPEKENKAISLYHTSEKGYGIGGQDFAEVYMKPEKKK